MPRRSAEERFWEKVNKTPTCWLWTRSTQKGYGAFWSGERLVRAHRFAWELLVGPIPEGMVLDHIVCENTLCVNPAHVEPKTNQENTGRGSARARVRREASRTHCVNGHSWAEYGRRRSDNAGLKCRRCEADAARRSAERRRHG